MRTVHYNDHAQNAAEIRDFRKGFKSLRKIFGILRKHRHAIAQLYPQAARDLERVLAAEKAMQIILQQALEDGLHHAQWAKDHGLRRLTTVREEDLLAFVEPLRQGRRRLLPEAPNLKRALAPAKRLAKALPRAKGVPWKGTISETLLEIAKAGDLDRHLEDYQYVELEEDDLRAFRERTQYALELERQARAAEASP